MTDRPPPPDQPPPYGIPYSRPPGAGHDPRWGYGPPGAPYGTPARSQGDETTWAIFAYIGMALVGFIAPLIIYCVKKSTSPFIRFHAAQALNHQITLLIHDDEEVPLGAPSVYRNIRRWLGDIGIELGKQPVAVPVVAPVAPSEPDVPAPAPAGA